MSVSRGDGEVSPQEFGNKVALIFLFFLSLTFKKLKLKNSCTVDTMSHLNMVKEEFGNNWHLNQGEFRKEYQKGELEYGSNFVIQYGEI